MTNNEDIDILILDHFHGSLTEDQENELERWVESSEKNRDYYVRTVAYLEATTATDSHQVYPAGKAWQKMYRRIKPGTVRRRLLFEFGKIAAIVVLAFLGGYFFLYLRQQQDNKTISDYVTTEVPYGSKSVVSLPDGSQVWINAGSKIIYAADFNKYNRKVVLEGEAFFDIITDKKKPFFVEAYGIKVKATGTRFNVRAYNDEGFIETILVEGVVSVMQAAVKNEKEFVLAPNQKLTFYKDQLNPAGKAGQVNKSSKEPDLRSQKLLQIRKVELESNVSTPVYTSWKDKEWIIYKEKLGTLARKLERRYDVRIIFKDDCIADFSYTGTLQDENLKELLDVMCVTSPINYKFEDKNVMIWYEPAFNERN